MVDLIGLAIIPSYIWSMKTIFVKHVKRPLI